MKKTLTFLTLATILVSCSKYPEPDRPIGLGIPAFYTNYYILQEISGIVKGDTITYQAYYIETYLTGYIIKENTFYSTQSCANSPNPYCALPTEQKYFINKIKNIEVSANKPYKNNTQEINDIKLFFRDKNRNYNEKEYYGEELGYAPIRIILTEPPDSSQKFIFQIKITDDNDNTFTCVTDSVYIKN